MRTALALAALLLVTACGSGDGTTATDPGDPGSTTGPTAIPAAPRTVRTRTVATVMDAGSPELCLGAVAESWPPQCSGPPIDGWDWSEHAGMYQKSGSTRWGQFVVSGTWDGSTFTYADATAAAVYDPMADPTPTYPPVEPGHARLREIAEHVDRDLPGALGARVDGKRVLADVVYDDGSLQDRVDRQYGAGVVALVPALVDAGS